MKTMTARERLFAALEGHSTDRVPIWLLFPWHEAPYYVDVRHHPAYQPIHELAQQCCITLNRRHLGAPLYRSDVEFRQADSSGSCHSLVWPGGRHEWPQGCKMLVEDADLEKAYEVPIEDDEAVLRPALERAAAIIRREREEFPADAGAMMLDLSEPIGHIYHSSNLESLSIWSVTHAELVEQMLENQMRRLRIMYRFALENDLADVYFFVGSELAAPPFVGLETFERWIVPYASELIELVRSYGKKTIQHFHGHIREVLPGFRQMNPDALHTIEAPPVGNCTWSEAYQALGNRMTLIGNVQYDDFRSMSEVAMRRAVRAVLEECAGQRLILSPSAGPYDPDPPATLINNYRIFIDEAWRHGAWEVG